MVMAGVDSKIPFDDAVAAMYKVGTGLPEELRETALGGCAITPTGKALQEKFLVKRKLVIIKEASFPRKLLLINIMLIILLSFINIYKFRYSF